MLPWLGRCHGEATANVDCRCIFCQDLRQHNNLRRCKIEYVITIWGAGKMYSLAFYLVGDGVTFPVSVSTETQGLSDRRNFRKIRASCHRYGFDCKAQRVLGAAARGIGQDEDAFSGTIRVVSHACFCRKREISMSIQPTKAPTSLICCSRRASIRSSSSSHTSCRISI